MARTPRASPSPATTPRGEGIPPRRVAFDVLIAVEKGRYADSQLARALSTAGLDQRDQGLATRLVYGTLAWQQYLDHLIETVSRPADTLDVPIRVALRLALFQLTKLSRIPDFAAVDTAVELAKGFRRGAAASFVNATLRRFLRERELLTRPAPNSDDAGDLSVALSHPRWLVELWLRELGTGETRALLSADNEPAPTVLRVNRMRTERAALLQQLANAGIAAHAGAFTPDAIVLDGGYVLTTLPGYLDGLFSVQGEASQLVGLLVGVRPGDRVWDACAAPGGKSTYLAEQMGNRGLVCATDVSQRGLLLLRGSADRLGLSCIDIAAADALTAPRADGPFDAVLVDAPCSGLGTLRQHPEIKSRRTLADLAQRATQQSRLLAAAAAQVRDGGVLVYATCTIARMENDDVVADFLATHPEFHIADPTPLLSQAARRCLDDRGVFRSFPHRDGLDGFFAVRLKRHGESRMVGA